MPDTKSQFGFTASDGNTLFHQNPFLPIMALESDKLQHSSAVGVSGHPVALPIQFPIVVNEANGQYGQYNYLVLDINQIQNPVLTLPVVPTSMHPPLGYIVASDGEMVHTSNPYAPILPAAYTASGHDSSSPQVEPFQRPTQVMTKSSADDKTLEQPMHIVVCSDGPPNSHVIASDGEMVHNSNPLLSLPPVECANSEHDSISPIENMSESPSQLMTETSSDDTTLLNHMSNVISMDRHIVISEEEIVQNINPDPPILSAESAISEHDSISPQEKLTEPPSQLLKETNLEVKTPNHSVTRRHIKSGKEVKQHDLMVMENLTYNRNIVRQYDLKGALFERYTSDATGVEDVLLDQNFVEDMNSSPLYVSHKIPQDKDMILILAVRMLLASTVFYLQLLPGINQELLPSVVSALCLLPFGASNLQVGRTILLQDYDTIISSNSLRVRCPLEANPDWRRSFYQPRKDQSLEFTGTGTENMTEYHACQTLLVVVANVLGGKKLESACLSPPDVEISSLIKWERSLLRN
ncbi:hypothetical protein RYX36_022278 [Vicia faba]